MTVHVKIKKNIDRMIQYRLAKEKLKVLLRNIKE